jgi:hypothetical protein
VSPPGPPPTMAILFPTMVLIHTFWVVPHLLEILPAPELPTNRTEPGNNPS